MKMDNTIAETMVAENAARRSEIAKFVRFFNHCLAAGVYFAPSQFETGFISLAHGPDDLAQTAEVVSEALKSL